MNWGSSGFIPRTGGAIKRTGGSAAAKYSQLTKLMIQYNLGVAVESVYEVKRLTSDFGLDDF